MQEYREIDITNQCFGYYDRQQTHDENSGEYFRRFGHYNVSDGVNHVYSHAEPNQGVSKNYYSLSGNHKYF